MKISRRLISALLIFAIILLCSCQTSTTTTFESTFTEEELLENSSSLDDSENNPSINDSSSGENSENKNPSNNSGSGGDKVTTSNSVNYPDSIKEKVLNDTTLFNKYDLDRFVSPVWQGKTVYYETICFERDKSGNISNAKLLYKPDKIIAVRSSDMKTTYIEGKDFKIANKTVIRLTGSSMKFAPYNEFHAPIDQVGSRKYPTTEDPNMSVIVRDNGSFLQKYQYVVFYTHSDGWDGETYPKSQEQHIPNTLKKLKNGEKVNIVFYGDSITAGMHTSGNKELARAVENGQPLQMPCWGNINYEPYVPAWAEMVTQKLRKSFPKANITKTNCAAPGAQSGSYGCKYINLVTDAKPDLVILAFGGNDVWMDKATFKNNYKTMIDAVLKTNPNCEFLCVSFMLPNLNIASFNKNREKHDAQEVAMYELQQEYSGKAGIGVVPVLSFWKDLVALGKKPCEWTSSYDTHPNDWGASIYAQLILNAMGI